MVHSIPCCLTSFAKVQGLAPRKQIQMQPAVIVQVPIQRQSTGSWPRDPCPFFIPHTWQPSTAHYTKTHNCPFYSSSLSDEPCLGAVPVRPLKSLEWPLPICRVNAPVRHVNALVYRVNALVCRPRVHHAPRDLYIDVGNEDHGSCLHGVLISRGKDVYITQQQRLRVILPGLSYQSQTNPSLPYQRHFSHHHRFDVTSTSLPHVR
ncbi:hypothetical protein B0I35DRAFT_185476 [Stachybotrys elegans]|uniref:Uncharacterized protein n=1 Tax=Stachybotrys elegans TaxID=80388 RepID=A0A8K0WTB3_9HYPO|nr:hypothetical protein B0I35DRAFT_185476 [Stachybotrys elegans]